MPLPLDVSAALEARAQATDALVRQGLTYKFMFHLVLHQWWRDRQKLDALDASMRRLMGVDRERRGYVA